MRQLTFNTQTLLHAKIAPKHPQTKHIKIIDILRVVGVISILFNMMLKISSMVTIHGSNQNWV